MPIGEKLSEKEIDETINMIQSVRAKNNIPWMSLVRIAFKYAPEEAAACFRQICDMDAQIMEHARKLAQ